MPRKSGAAASFSVRPSWQDRARQSHRPPSEAPACKELPKFPKFRSKKCTRTPLPRLPSRPKRREFQKLEPHRCSSRQSSPKRADRAAGAALPDTPQSPRQSARSARHFPAQNQKNRLPPSPRSCRGGNRQAASLHMSIVCFSQSTAASRFFTVYAAISLGIPANLMRDGRAYPWNGTFLRKP